MSKEGVNAVTAITVTAVPRLSSFWLLPLLELLAGRQSSMTCRIGGLRYHPEFLPQEADQAIGRYRRCGFKIDIYQRIVDVPGTGRSDFFTRRLYTRRSR